MCDTGRAWANVSRTADPSPERLRDTYFPGARTAKVQLTLHDQPTLRDGALHLNEVEVAPLAVPEGITRLGIEFGEVPIAAAYEVVGMELLVW